MIDGLNKPDELLKEYNYCYLVDQQKDIRSTSFNVHIPKLMPLIPRGLPTTQKVSISRGRAFANDISVPSYQTKNHITMQTMPEPLWTKRYSFGSRYYETTPYVYAGHRFIFVNIDGLYTDMKIISG